MKTPEDIKKGLEQCAETETCENCDYRDDCMKQLKNAPLNKDALAYIQQLEADLQREKDQHQYTIDAANVMKDEALKFESRLAQAERERDAAVADLSNSCSFCKHVSGSVDEPPCTDCFHPKNNIVFAPITRTKFEWRGVCPKNTKEDPNAEPDSVCPVRADHPGHADRA